MKYEILEIEKGSSPDSIICQLKLAANRKNVHIPYSESYYFSDAEDSNYKERIKHELRYFSLDKVLLDSLFDGEFRLMFNVADSEDFFMFRESFGEWEAKFLAVAANHSKALVRESTAKTDLPKFKIIKKVVRIG